MKHPMDVRPRTLLLSAFMLLCACGQEQEGPHSPAQQSPVDMEKLSFRLALAEDPAVFSMAALKEDLLVHCSGTLISPRWLLTAAHCATLHATVVFGAEMLAEEGTGTPPAQTRTIKRFVVHSKFDQNWERNQGLAEIPASQWVNPRSAVHDIALIELSSPVTAPFAPARLADSSHVITANQTVVSAGFGLQVTSEANLEFLRQGKRAPQGQLKLMESVFEEDLAGLGEFVVGHRTKGGLCLGDSGGAMLWPGQATPTILGVASHGTLPCGAPGSRVGFVDVREYRDWIRCNSDLAVRDGLAQNCEEQRFLAKNYDPEVGLFMYQGAATRWLGARPVHIGRGQSSSWPNL